MDLSSTEWLSNLAMEDDEIAIVQEKSGDDATKDQRLQAEYNIYSSWSSCATSSSCHQISGKLISFGRSDNSDDTDDQRHNKAMKKEERVTVVDHVQGGTKNSLRKVKDKWLGSIQEHVLAERKRRQKMNQMFEALSALVPGLKQMDRASILDDAIKYLKQLEEQVKMLEEQTANRVIESVVVVMKIMQDRNLDDGNNSSLYNNNCVSSLNPLLEIEARASNSNILIRIHSQRHQGLILKVLNEIEKLHLTTLNCNTMSFGVYAMETTVVAQMDDDFGLTLRDLVMRLRLVSLQFLLQK